MQVRDARSDGSYGANALNPVTQKQSSGGFLDAAGIDLGNGTGLLLTVNVTRATTTVAPATVSTQLLAASSDRVAVTIVNTDATHNLYIGENGTAAVVGTNPVKPGAAFNVPGPAAAGLINGIWDAGATGDAQITATTA